MTHGDLSKISTSRLGYKRSAGMSMEVIVTIVSKLVYNLFRGLANCLYRGYNPFTKYHGHPSGKMCVFFCRTELLGFKNVNRSKKKQQPRIWVK